jgi:hypothetical protein
LHPRRSINFNASSISCATTRRTDALKSTRIPVASIAIRERAALVDHKTFRRVTTDSSLAEHEEENALEFLAKYHIDDEVHTRIYCHKEIGCLDKAIVDDAEECLENVHDERQNVAAKEHNNDDEEHRRQSNLPFLGATQSLTFSIRQPHLSIDHRVEEGDADERDEVDEN